MAEPEFLLLHGAWHRGSSWAPLQAELRARGRASVAPDLPADEPGAGAAEYVAAALAAAPAEGPVVVVGHSLGGLTAPLVAAELGARTHALVLVAAMLPEPGRAHNDLLREDRTIMASGRGPGPERGPGGTTSWPPEAAEASLYAGVAEELGAAEPVREAIADLRPQAWVIGKEVTPLTAWPAVRTVSVICGDDRMVNPETSRRLAGARGFEVRELPGGHFPMLTRPAALADLLTGL
ncbi:alpha/beta hydrolase [Pseudonocardia sp. RS11V-5]|uniref:alpha/beta fold hydrolase n=1 Tax=Pseudonocardia terrae TaxID=2905831 RepID=UPI001E638BD0|nr:alpha/beta hydrolase [Pseudonocardia terrae]MCE3553698.1 alpha/beta hydrolase [Pseudonocardia terrae]